MHLLPKFELGLSFMNLPSPNGFALGAHVKGEQFPRAYRISPFPELMHNLAVKSDCPHLLNVIPSSTNLTLEFYLLTSIYEIIC
jgi:hypothetical protein